MLSFMLSRSFGYCVCLLALISSASPVAAQDELSALPRSFPALQLTPEEQIELDGLLTESAWDRAEPAGEFIQQEPTEGGVPTERTEVYVLYSRDVLYIGAILYDSEPEGILGHQKQRDQGLGPTIGSCGCLTRSWTGGPATSSRPTRPACWVTPDACQQWPLRRVEGVGRHLEREDRPRQLRVCRWRSKFRFARSTSMSRSIPGGSTSKHRPPEAGGDALVGPPPEPGAVPRDPRGAADRSHRHNAGAGSRGEAYGATAWREVADEGTEVPADVGFDLNYNLTSSLKTAVSVNTDFAETEVDRRRVNLTRFPLFFPEQRDFFLENGAFQLFTGQRGDPVLQPDIGLAGGKEVPIVFGSRLTGQAGAHDLGFLQVRTDESDELGTEDFTIGRVKRNFWRQSTIGAIYTRRATGALEEDLGPLDRHTVGADLDLVTSTFLGDKNLQFEAFYVWHNDPERDGTSGTADRSARGIRFNYPNDIWRAHVSFRELGDAFDPAMGFTRRNGFRRVQPSLTWAPRPERWESVRQMEFEVFYEHLLDLENVLQTRRTNFTLFQTRFQSGDWFAVRSNNTFERLEEPFEISDGVVLPDRGVSLQRVPVRRPHGQSADGLGQHRLQEGGVLVGKRQVDELRPYRQAAPGDHALDQLPAR